MGDRTELLGHCEAALFQPGLRCGDFNVQRAVEVGARERDGEGEAETAAVQLVDGDDGKRTSLRLLASTRWFGIGPIDLALLRSSAYHSGVGALKAASISLLSAR